MSLLLGIDVGTTGVRAAAFEPDGRLVADASEPCPPDAPRAGWAEADPERWWKAVAGVCARVTAQAGPDVAAIGVTGQAPTAVLVDAEGTAIAPALLWLDVRAGEEARTLERALGAGVAESLGGNRVHAYFLGPKLAWLRAHRGDVLDRASWVLQSHAYVAMRLTGVAGCDASTAMLCTPLFDAKTQRWSEAGARAAGVNVAQLPPLRRSHDVLGGLTKAVAAATGLREGTPVVAGGGDFAASALGAGVVEEGQACLMLGTAGNLLMPMKEPRFDSRLINSHHVGADRWLALGGTLCGAALEWMRGAVAPGIAWEPLEAEASAVAVGSEGVVMLPYLQGERTPVWDEQARGVFAGLGLGHGRGHLVRAVFEGIALGFADCLAVARDAGTTVTEAVAANGAGRSPLLRQTLADAMGIPVTWSPDHGATVWGAAILAGMGTGVLGGPRVSRSEEVEVRRHEPNPHAHEVLTRVMQTRRAVQGAVHPRR